MPAKKMTLKEWSERRKAEKKVNPTAKQDPAVVNASPVHVDSIVAPADAAHAQAVHTSPQSVPKLVAPIVANHRSPITDPRSSGPESASAASAQNSMCPLKLPAPRQKIQARAGQCGTVSQQKPKLATGEESKEIVARLLSGNTQIPGLKPLGNKSSAVNPPAAAAAPAPPPPVPARPAFDYTNGDYYRPGHESRRLHDRTFEPRYHSRRSYGSICPGSLVQDKSRSTSSYSEPRPDREREHSNQERRRIPKPLSPRRKTGASRFADKTANPLYKRGRISDESQEEEGSSLPKRRRVMAKKETEVLSSSKDADTSATTPVQATRRIAKPRTRKRSPQASFDYVPSSPDEGPQSPILPRGTISKAHSVVENKQERKKGIAYRVPKQGKKATRKDDEDFIVEG
ncbi:hypothetical protein P280DRAFT_514275 [Massarina eburnea CBS 473.64]|uniref:Uncharacterized protein n=1 Tax=Massarina eburnea CBS 473.64 TaxID=1395130 RepID=A0A6A6SB70_9PLEO|nr:hypothetical protein P280DRAFT_514275 [Massarina eburnea CBS 473.64]